MGFLSFRPQGEITPVEVADRHSRPKSVVVNLPSNNLQEPPEEIDVNSLDSIIQNLETIQEEMDQKEEMAEMSIEEFENANGTETMMVHSSPSSLIERRVVYSVHTGSFE